MQLNTANKLHPLEHPATQNCLEESTQNIDPCNSEPVIPPECLQQGDSCSDSFPRSLAPGLCKCNSQTLNHCQHCQAPVKVKQQQAHSSLAWVGGGGAQGAAVLQSW